MKRSLFTFVFLAVSAHTLALAAPSPMKNFWNSLKGEKSRPDLNESYHSTGFDLNQSGSRGNWDGNDYHSTADSRQPQSQNQFQDQSGNVHSSYDHQGYPNNMNYAVHNNQYGNAYDFNGNAQWGQPEGFQHPPQYEYGQSSRAFDPNSLQDYGGGNDRPTQSTPNPTYSQDSRAYDPSSPQYGHEENEEPTPNMANYSDEEQEQDGRKGNGWENLSIVERMALFHRLQIYLPGYNFEKFRNRAELTLTKQVLRNTKSKNPAVFIGAINTMRKGSMLSPLSDREMEEIRKTFATMKPHSSYWGTLSKDEWYRIYGVLNHYTLPYRSGILRDICEEFLTPELESALLSGIHEDVKNVINELNFLLRYHRRLKPLDLLPVEDSVVVTEDPHQTFSEVLSNVQNDDYHLIWKRLAKYTRAQLVPIIQNYRGYASLSQKRFGDLTMTILQAKRLLYGDEKTRAKTMNTLYHRAQYPRQPWAQYLSEEEEIALIQTVKDAIRSSEDRAYEMMNNQTSENASQILSAANAREVKDILYQPKPQN